MRLSDFFLLMTMKMATMTMQTTIMLMAMTLTIMMIMMSSCVEERAKEGCNMHAEFRIITNVC